MSSIKYDEVRNTDPNLVEIELDWKMQVSVPTRYGSKASEGKEGLLTFKEVEVNSNWTTIKCLVPVEVTKSQAALQKYVRDAQIYHDAEFADLSDINIWDRKQEKFLFD